MQESGHKKLKRRVRRRTIVFLVLTLIGNAFAWFIYSNKVATSMNVGVKSWKITFEQNGNNVFNNVVFNVDNIYPGMTDYSDRIEIRNSGEMAASVTYEVTSVRVFTDTFTNNDYTSDQLENILLNNYPFKIVFTVDNPTIGTTDTTNFRMSVIWPYEASGESGDELDTYWGKRAYDFENTYANQDEIEVHIKVIATQTEIESE